MKKAILIFFIIHMILSSCLDNQKRRKIFKYNGVNFMIDSIGSEEFTSYMKNCLILGESTWIDTNITLDYDTIAVNKRSNPFFIQYYNNYFRSKTYTIMNINNHDTTKLFSRVYKNRRDQKFHFFWRMIDNLNLYSDGVTNYNHKFPNANLGLYDKLMEHYKIDSNLYDFTKFQEYQHIKFNICNWGDNVQILYYIVNKGDNTFNNLLFFSNQSQLYKLLIKYHGQISTDIFTQQYMYSW